MSAPERPPYRLLLAVSLLLCAPLLWPAAGGLGVGAYRMFTRVQRVRLSVEARDASGRPTRLSLAALAPHLSRDARRILLAAEQGLGGETALDLLAEGLPELARWACRVTPAPAVRVRLERSDLHGPLPALIERRDCDEARR